VPDDDPTITPETLLFRRVHPSQLIWDENEGRLRPTSNAFKDPEMSVSLGDELDRLGEPPVWCLRVDPDHHLASITAELAREKEQVVYRDPLESHPRYGDDPTHGIVEGRKKGARSSEFAKRATVEEIRVHSLKPGDRELWEASETGGGEA
jgi:hypothetical protein